MSWRAHVLGMKAVGRITDVGWRRLIEMMDFRSDYYVRGLIDNPNPYAVIRNPHQTRADLHRGAVLFRKHCSGCHGLDGRGGGHAPDIVDRKLDVGASDWAVFRTLEVGIPGTAMMPVAMNDLSRWQIVGYLSQLRRMGQVAPSTTPTATGAVLVTADRLEHARNEPDNWLSYSGAYDGWRHSALKTIDAASVARLGLAWAIQVDAQDMIETSPIVADGVMFLSTPPSNVRAIDATNGSTLWTYQRAIPRDAHDCCGRVNRGVAVLGDAVFVGTLDAHLVAIDSSSGDVRWDVAVAPYADGYTITAAPLAVEDKIIVGVSGGEFGIRGFLDAYDAKTGRRLWRFHTIPAPGEPGNKTWRGESWKTGGGPTWITGSYDSQRRILYWGVGNPSPDFNGATRAGDNLYTNSVVALKVDSGELAWHFQFTPHDEHDWDSNQTPVLVDEQIGAERRPLMLWANRNGFYYVLDRSDGTFIRARAFVPQNWATRIDEAGRPVLSEFGRPSRTGTLTKPGASGGTNWWPPSYSPDTNLIYVPCIELAAVFFNSGDKDELREGHGNQLLGSGTTMAGGDSVQTVVRALHPLTGEVAWERKMPRRQGAGQIGGTMSTAGDLVFVGDYETFYALDASSGAVLWRVNLGGRINAPPVTYAVRGRQFVTIAAGSSIFSFALPASNQEKE